MKRTIFQHPTILDDKGNVIQQGTYSKESPLVNSTNDGVLDYINNNLEALRDNINGSRIYVKNKDALTTPGDISAMYIAEDTGKWYLWDGTKYIETDNARKIADEAIAARDAANASQAAAKTSEQNAKASEADAAASKQAAATSAGAAKASENNAGTQASTAKAWATATTSPDGAADTASSTGKTQSAKSWALYSKDRAAASAASASAAATSAEAAKTSENNAANSKTAAATSADNAATSANAAASSAKAAADSARVNQADWNVTDTSNQAFIKNKPDVIAFKVLPYRQAVSYEKNTIQVTSGKLPDDLSDMYEYGVLTTIGSPDMGGCFLSYIPDDESLMYKCIWNGRSKNGWRTSLDDKNFSEYALPKDGIAVKATADDTGNNIQNTYARKDNASITNLTVTGETTVPTANEGNSSKAIANTEFVAKSLASLVNGAPDQLNTLNELAKALGNDANFAATITAELAKKLNSTEAESTYATKTEAGVPYQIKRNTTYKVGDVLTSPSLPPGCVIVVTQAGTTGSTEPDWTTIKGNMGGVITDGTAKFVVTQSFGVLSGTITAFSGTFNNGFPIDKNTGLVNREWHLCDGTNGTPDLRSRFIYGGDGTNNGATGGEASHKLTEAELPPAELNEWVYGGKDGGDIGWLSSHDGNHVQFSNLHIKGGNQPHNNMPPYYVLAYIMKL